MAVDFSWFGSGENSFCHISNHLSCWEVKSFPGCLKDRVSISRSRVLKTFMTNIVFQSGTENRPLLPSRIITPEYICAPLAFWLTRVPEGCFKRTYVAANVATKQCNSKRLDGRRLVCVVHPVTY